LNAWKEWGRSVVVLKRIVARKRREVQERKARVSLVTLKEKLPLSDRSLEEALRQSHHGYIMECKRASPSRGPIAPNLKVEDIIEAYKPFADGVSVLTDKEDFGGSFADLKQIRDAIPQPVLCKDFVVDPYQVYEARSHGADAILLMLSVLNDDSFRVCFAACEEVAMDALVEVHDQPELDRAIQLGARIIGINNRNLKDLKIDLRTSEALIPRAPKEAVIISESGILNRDHVRRLRPLSDAFLVGTALLLKGQPRLAARQLIFGRTKVCGLTRIADARIAYKLGATYGGLIFATKSPRRITLAAAKILVDSAPLKWVGVFVNAPINQICEAVETLKLSAVQLHGDESPEDIKQLRALLPMDCEIWKAVQVKESIPDINNWAADRLLLDTYSKSARGGTGHCFDWSLLGAFPDKSRLIIAGGINPDNAPAAEAISCFAIDVNSGVELAPGLKDENKMRSLFSALRGQK
jgi:indole-3-glycerol phosphate synthase / phosphoribosylanthranilate isomerase